MLLYNVIRKTLNWQRRIEKESTLFKFRDIDPEWIVAVVKCNQNLLLVSQENVQIFMAMQKTYQREGASLTRNNSK